MVRSGYNWKVKIPSFLLVILLIYFNFKEGSSPAYLQIEEEYGVLLQKNPSYILQSDEQPSPDSVLPSSQLPLFISNITPSPHTSSHILLELSCKFCRHSHLPFIGEDWNPFFISQYLQIMIPLLLIGVRQPIISLHIPLTRFPTRQTHLFSTGV